MNNNIKCLTHGPKHHLFGFHDLVQTNAKDDFALSLEVDDISRPPLPGESCRFGIVTKDGEFHAIHTTHTWNYPQGARQQWIGDSDLFTCNDRAQNNDVFAWVADARSMKTIARLDFPVHCVESRTGKAIFIDYDRLHAVGGYGYVSGRQIGTMRLADMPDYDGLWIGDMKSGKRALLASLSEIALCGERKRVKTGFPHYITHPMLNPDGTRVAFLHRYRVADGGETSRLMTIGLDGSGLRCLAKGFLSHFTWIANDEIFIWGANQPALYALREASYLRYPGISLMVKVTKGILRKVRNTLQKQAMRSSAQSMTFLRIKDSTDAMISHSAIGILTEDGHPMARPGELTCLINDTYPDGRGERTLMLYNIQTNVRTDIGKFRMLDDQPDLSSFDASLAQAGTDTRIVRKFDRELYMLARSGLHCDLHPRWSWDGRKAYFDSIHEGTRQIYVVEFEGYK